MMQCGHSKCFAPAEFRIVRVPPKVEYPVVTMTSVIVYQCMPHTLELLSERRVASLEMLSPVPASAQSN
ncbi:MAG: hypothetical protein ACHQX3_00310 [Nitrospirales bacterium]|jgi:hypothetical protein